MKVLLTGANGQLGQALLSSVPRNIDLIALDRSDLDLSDLKACHSMVLRHKPDWVLNAAAYTAVDMAESEPRLAHVINADAPRIFSEALSEIGGSLLQLSTDFVFNGKQSIPYHCDHPCDPLSVYGSSKAAGEKAALQVFETSEVGFATILRTGWVYGPVGNNFMHTILRLNNIKSILNEPLCVVADQVGCPTSTFGLSSACWAAISHNISGILHWSDAGVASWYDFAVAIGEFAVEFGLIPEAAQIIPISSSEFSTVAQRPYYSLLDCTDSRVKLQLSPTHWRSSLKRVFSHVCT